MLTYAVTPTPATVSSDRWLTPKANDKLYGGDMGGCEVSSQGISHRR